MIRKIFLFLFLCGFIYSTMNAQQLPTLEVPGIVDLYVKFHFPHLKDTEKYKIDYEKVGENYKASFLVNDEPAYIILDKEGTLIKKAYQIPLWGIPKAVDKSIKKEHKGYEIFKLFKITDPTATKFIYQVSFNVTGYFTPEGVKTKVKEEELAQMEGEPISVKKLPPAIVHALDSLYEDYTVEDSYLYRSADTVQSDVYKLSGRITDFYMVDGRKTTAKKEPL